MPIKHGVSVNEVATAVSTPVKADCGVPFVVGTAPFWTAPKGLDGSVNHPVLCTSFAEFKEYFGYSDTNWDKYTLCEFAYSHFVLYGCQPVIFVCPEYKVGASVTKSYTVTNRKAVLPYNAGGTLENPMVVKNSSVILDASEYEIIYDEAGSCVIEIKAGATNASATELTVTYYEYKVEGATTSDIATAFGLVDECMEVGVIPDIFCAPGYSHDSEIAAVMAVKAGAVSGIFRGKALIDAPDTVVKYSDVYSWKTQNNIVDENQVVCFPKLGLGERVFHQSTQLAGLMAQIDTGNGCPYESPSNKNYQMDRLVVGEGNNTLRQTKAQADILNSYGVVTALNFLASGWVCWGNYTACYPANSDVKDMFIPVSRMFDWVANTAIRTFWNKIDEPMNRRLIDNVLDTCNIWLNGLVGAGYLLGARIEFAESENPLTDLMAGIMKFHIFMTPPTPAQEIDFTLEYDVNYLNNLFSAGEE